MKPELFLVFAVWPDASQETLILKERCFFPWRWQLLGIRGWWMTSFAIPNSCVTPDGQKQSGVGILRPRASWTGTEKSLQDFKNQCNITGTLAICAAWRFAVCTTSRNPTIAPVPAGKYFALYMQWLGPIQLSWTKWILKNHFFATAMLLFTTQHITRLSHQNVCSGSKMLRTLKKELLHRLWSTCFICHYYHTFVLKKNLEPKNNIKTQSRNLSSKKITLYDLNY